MSRLQLQASAGFTMLEMMVVVAIVLMITATVIAYVPQFRDRSALDLVAQEVAVTVRGAQVYASGGRTTTAFTDDDSRPSYGAHFKEGEGKFSIFANKDGLEGPNTAAFSSFDEVLPNEEYALHGIMIDSVCAVRSGDSECGQGRELDITYTRPRLEAVICLDGHCGFEAASVTIKAERSGQMKEIQAYANGQISVTNKNETE